MTRKQLMLSLAVILLAGNLACAAAGPSLKSAVQPEPETRAAARVPDVVDPATGMELVFVKGGCFVMGSAAGAPGGREEKPAHEVCVGDMYLGKFEVTQGQWAAVMGGNPSFNASCGVRCPVDSVSWLDAQEFIGKLNAAAGSATLPPGRYRLPTEAEWEYAARSGGKNEKWAGGDVFDAVAWHLWNAKSTQPVGLKAPNGLGLHDMSGNVWEWTADWYDAAYYSSSPRDNPTGPAVGEYRVLRGGSVVNEAFDLRATYRNYLPPDHRGARKGFRVARDAPGQPR